MSKLRNTLEWNRISLYTNLLWVPVINSGTCGVENGYCCAQRVKPGAQRVKKQVDRGRSKGKKVGHIMKDSW